MKTPEQWDAELPCGIDTNYPYLRSVDFIRAIQRDALEAAAKKFESSAKEYGKAHEGRLENVLNTQAKLIRNLIPKATP